MESEVQTHIGTYYLLRLKKEYPNLIIINTVIIYIYILLFFLICVDFFVKPTKRRNYFNLTKIKKS